VNLISSQSHFLGLNDIATCKSPIVLAEGVLTGNEPLIEQLKDKETTAGTLKIS